MQDCLICGAVGCTCGAAPLAYGPITLEKTAMANWIADRRIYLDKDGKAVEADDPKRVKLLVHTGQSLPLEQAQRLGLVNESAVEAAQRAGLVEEKAPSRPPPNKAITPGQNKGAEAPEVEVDLDNPDTVVFEPDLDNPDTVVFEPDPAFEAAVEQLNEASEAEKPARKTRKEAS